MQPNLTISIAQNNIVWEDKQANLRQIDRYLSQLQTPTHLVVFPEMFLTGFSNNNTFLAESMNGETVIALQQMAKQYRVILIGSLMIREEENIYNRLCWFYPNGIIHHYDKKHLFSHAHEDEYYTAGNKRLITSVNGWRVLSLICYDIRFPVWCRQNPANDEYDILICIANWPKNRITQWQKLLEARAIENQAFVVGVNRTGIDANAIVYNGHSCIVYPFGDTLVLMPESQQQSVHTFEKKDLIDIRQQYQFKKEADDFALL